jgi:cell shape-determining protein MreC
MQTNTGLIQFIIIIILSVIILSLLGVSLRSLFTDQTLLENFRFLWDFIKHIWYTYITPYFDSLRSRFKEYRENNQLEEETIINQEDDLEPETSGIMEDILLEEATTTSIATSTETGL